MPTLDDVARRAGVSRVTASRVLNGTYVNKVSASTRERVLKAVAELNYHSSIPARALRSKRTMEFGLLIPDLAFSFMPEVVQGLQDVATHMDYGCLVYLSHGQPQQEERAYRSLVARRVDGIVWMPHPQPLPETLALVHATPVVQILFRCGGLHAPAVLVDQEQGGYEATRHLIDLGHRHIAYVLVDHRHWIQREAGYRRALMEKGIPYNPALVVTTQSNSWEDGLNTARKLMMLSSPPTAIIAASDAAAWGTLIAIREAGLRVPDDVSVVGFGNVSYSEQVDVPLSTVDHPKREVGQLAMRMLAALIEGTPVSDCMLPARLVHRASSGPPPGPQE